MIGICEKTFEPSGIKCLLFGFNHSSFACSPMNPFIGAYVPANQRLSKTLASFWARIDTEATFNPRLANALDNLIKA